MSFNKIFLPLVFFLCLGACGGKNTPDSEETTGSRSVTESSDDFIFAGQDQFANAGVRVVLKGLRPQNVNAGWTQVSGEKSDCNFDFSDWERNNVPVLISDLNVELTRNGDEASFTARDEDVDRPSLLFFRFADAQNSGDLTCVTLLPLSSWDSMKWGGDTENGPEGDQWGKEEAISDNT